MTTQEVIDAIFNDPKVKYDLIEFQGLNKTIPEMLNIYSRQGIGKQTGKEVYYIKPLCKFHSEKEEFQIYVEGGKSCPEEIVRQLWVWKLINYYGYSPEQIRCEIPVQFGSSEATKFADIAVYRKSDLETVKILFEVKKPKRKDGIEQLKSYLGAKGNPIGVWSNGADKLILYKPDNKDLDTLSEIPNSNEEAKDVMEVKRTLSMLKTQFNFKKIIQDLEELVLASAGGVNEFDEIFKIIFAKIWDEKQAQEDKRNRPKQELHFVKSSDPSQTYQTINQLFHDACDEWQGVFKEGEDIELLKDHLQVCIGPIESIRLLGANLRIMDDAFEYLMPTEAKKKKGQFFTPRHVIEMCVRMLNPKPNEYVIDPSCGSAGFLLHAMQWAWPADNLDDKEKRKSKYASKYLWGIDFEAGAAKTSRALMLIAGDGHTNIFGPKVDSIDLSTWNTINSGIQLMSKLRETRKLTKMRIPQTELFTDSDKIWEYFGELNFDLVLANPPFAGELKDRKMLQHYNLAAPALRRAKDKQPKEERDVIFIERIINLLKPGGRAAIVLPQGKFNNSSLAFIREFILHKARLLAVVGLHANTFKPHTGTKTSVLIIQKYTEEQLDEIELIKNEVSSSCPDYETQIRDLIESKKDVIDIDESDIPNEILAVLNEEFPNEENDSDNKNIDDRDDDSIDESIEMLSLEEKIEKAEIEIENLSFQKHKTEMQLQALNNEINCLVSTQKEELDKFMSIKGLDKKKLSEEKKRLQLEHKLALKELKEKNKIKEKTLKVDLRYFEKQIPLKKYYLLKLTNKGRLKIILNIPEVLERLRSRYIDEEVSKRLDYPIFMAVSERGGKNNSGDYEYMYDEKGNYIEDEIGNPEIDQDLVNHSITSEYLREAAANYHLGKTFISDHDLCIAEAFVKFAIEQKLDFWKEV